MSSINFTEIYSVRQGQLNFLLYGQPGELIRVGRSVKIIIIILSFRVGTFENKNNDHRVREICTILSTQVTYETDHISFLCDSTKSSAPNLCFFMYFIVI